ncbi:sulfuric ester hydrolase activity protein, partial [Halocaridina rubra]
KGTLDPLEPRGLPLNIRILPQPLKKLGYTTHAIGKWHLGFCNWRYTPTKRGFDTFYGFYTGAEDYYTHSRNDKPLKNRGRGRKISGKNTSLDLRNNTKPDHTKDGVYSTYVFASAAEEVIRSRNPKRPMFLYLPFQSVHAPLQVPKNYTRVYRKVKNYYRRNYLAMVLAMDDAVGRVVDALKATGHYKNSIIIFTTDNGGSVRMGASNYPLRGGKANLLEGGTRGPAFIHSPLLPNPGTVSNQLFHVTDWFNTILALAGGKAPSFTDGMDQWYALAGLSEPPRTKLIYNIDATNKFKAAIRFNEMKLAVGHVGKKYWAPYYPVRLRQGKPRSYLLPESYDNMTEINEYSSSASNFPLSFTSGNVSFENNEDFLESEVLLKQGANEVLFEDVDGAYFDGKLDDIYHQGSKTGGFPEGNYSYTSNDNSDDEFVSYTNNINEIWNLNHRSPRLRDPFIAAFGRKPSRGVSSKPNRKKTKIKNKRPLKIPIKNSSKLKNKENNYKPNKNKLKHKNKKQRKKQQHRPGKPNTKNKNKNENKKNKDKPKNKNKNKNKPDKTKDKDKNKIKPQMIKKKKNKRPSCKGCEVTNRLKASGHSRWRRIKRHRKLSWDRKVLRKLDRFLNRKTKISLYNITADPGESRDLSKENVVTVQLIMNYLAYQLYRYVPSKAKRELQRGHPQNFNGVWTPGWCNAK